MNASILMALVVILGFAHLPSQKSFPLAHKGPGSPGASDVLAEIGTDGTDTKAKSQIAAHCSFALSDNSLDQSCPSTPRSCDDYLAKKYQAAAGVPTLNLEPQAAPPSRPSRINCVESVAINSLTIELRESGSACS
jgi:hypothetical protein